jgi:hypothetical protein
MEKIAVMRLKAAAKFAISRIYEQSRSFVSDCFSLFFPVGTACATYSLTFQTTVHQDTGLDANG